MPRAREKATTLQSNKTLHKDLSFSASEAYKVLRANIQFILPKEGEDATGCRVIGVSSSIYGEGKSTTSINLCYVLAESGKRVLLIDGDMRLPSVGKNMKMQISPGLSNLLVSSDNESKIMVRKSRVLENWFVMTSGDIPPNPSELLGSGRMRALLKTLSREFDYIIVDLPPINMVSDALVVSPILDGLLLVVRENYTTRKEVSACMHQLSLADAKVLGIVLNCVKESASRYGRYKKYKKYYKKTDKED